MNLIRDEEKKKLKIVDDDGVILLEFCFFMDEFTCTLYTTNPVVIPKSVDDVFYDCLQNIMDSKYDFSNKLSAKNDNTIVWFSDQYCDLDNEDETDRINRLVIIRENDTFAFSIVNPFLERNEIRRTYAVVAFSPAGNGSFNRNLATGSSFQDDIVNAFNNIMNGKRLGFKKKDINKNQ